MWHSRSEALDGLGVGLKEIAAAAKAAAAAGGGEGASLQKTESVEEGGEEVQEPEPPK